MSKIDKIVMIDQGGGGGNGNGNGHSSGINRFAQTGPTLIFNLLQQLQALGISWPEVLAQLGVDGGGGNGGEKPIKPVTPTVEEIEKP